MSALMHKSLWLLIRLSVGARLRSLGKLTKSWKGRFVLLCIVGVIGLWLVGTLIGTGAGRFSPDTIRSLGALSLAVMLFATVVFGGNEGGVAFSPAEVEFLFPAPIPRRHLLIYRIVLVVLIALPTSIFIGCTFQRNTPTLTGAWLGTWLSFSFLSLAQMAWQLISGIAAQATVARSKKVIGGIVVVVLLASLATGALGMQLSFDNVVKFGESRLGKGLLSPFLPFGSVLAAADLNEVASNAAVCLGIILAVIFLILKLDVNHTEASLGASERMAKRVEDARRGRVIHNKGNGFLQRFSVPALPRLQGAGPIAWHQLTALLRSAGTLAIFIGILGSAMSAPLLMSKSLVLRQALVAVITMSVFLLPQFIQYDFRAEIDRMPVLKALPLNPIAIVCGELLAPVLVTLLVQMGMIGLAVLLGGIDTRMLLLIGAFVIPVDFLIYMAENFVFLLFPFRLGPNNGQDLQTMLRVMLTMLLKFGLICALLGAAAGLGGLVYYFTKTEIAAYVIAWVTVVASCVGLLAALGWAFKRFDPAMDTPG